MQEILHRVYATDIYEEPLPASDAEIGAAPNFISYSNKTRTKPVNAGLHCRERDVKQYESQLAPTQSRDLSARASTGLVSGSGRDCTN